MFKWLKRFAKPQAPRYAPVRAYYDAAQTTPEFQNYWAQADAFDADSANSSDVRLTLMKRSRYEVANNGYADGIAQTYATDLVGCGPTLRMQTNSTGFNQMVEASWVLWCKEVQLRRKLWCMTHAKHVDGEAFGVIRRNKRLKHPIKLDVVLHEADQVSTPYLAWGDDNYIDGIKFDEFGNPLWYDLLKYHPGSVNNWSVDMNPERIPANRMLHWFKLRRPGQHRGVPECASTLQVGASSRRMREATVSAVETAASLGGVLLKTGYTPDQTEQIAPLSTSELQRKMMTALPAGWDAMQMDSKHPNAQYAEFLRSQINELARPKNMPYNKAACDSSSYNYASGRLDHQTYYGALDVEREDCNDLVLDPLFAVWFDAAILYFGWLGGDPEAVGAGARWHLWDWPNHQVADIKAEAQANQQKLASGQFLLPRLYAEAGLDFEDEIQLAAPMFGVTPEELRKRLLDASIPAPKSAEKPAAEQDAPEDVAAGILLNRLNGHLNGVPHG